MKDTYQYQALADKLDSFPQGFPSASSGVELELLALLFSPEEAGLAARFSLTFSRLEEICDDYGISIKEARTLVKNMAGKGLIKIKRGENGIEVRLLPFVVGFYENQVATIDEEFARLFEIYYREAMPGLLSLTPQFHRVVPVKEAINTRVEILPEDNVASLLSNKAAWAVMDCICRKQKELIGEGCDHPIRSCLIMSETPGVFDEMEGVDTLDLDGALEALDQAAAAGLVHTVSNHKRDISYVCNCCTCSCGILRGIADANIANVVARSAYMARVDEDFCITCGICEEDCQFSAISIEDIAVINRDKCVGCGVCARACPEEAISLVLRPEDEILPIPESHDAWLEVREKARAGMDAD
jgi:ferredoxin